MATVAKPSPNIHEMDSGTLGELSRRFDAKLASLNASDSADKINSLFSSDVENNRRIRPKVGQPFVR